MDNITRLKLGSEFGNVLAYDPNKPAPSGYEKVAHLSANTPAGFMATTYYNSTTHQIIVAIAGTNDSKDVVAWSSVQSVNSAYSGNILQIDAALVVFKRIQEFARANGASVLTAGHSFAGEFVDIGAATFLR